MKNETTVLMKDIQKINLALSHLEDICNTLDKCGFVLQGFNQDPDYVKSSGAFLNWAIDKYHTNNR